MAESVDPEKKSKCDLKLGCDLCRLDDENVAAESFCVDCLDYLCKKCLDSHSVIEVYTNHTITDKDKFPLNITRDILKALKEVIICGVHESQCDYYCEDHAKLICQACIRKGHRNCKRVKKIHSSNKIASSEILAVEIRQETLKQQKTEKVNAILDEKRHQDELRLSILSKIQNFFEQFDRIVEREAQAICSNVNAEEKANRTLHVTEESLRAVSILNDEKKTMVVAKYVQLELAKLDSSSVQNDRLNKMKTGVTDTSKRLEMLSNITAVLVNNKIDFVDEGKGNVVTWNVFRASCLPQYGIDVSQPILPCSDAGVQTEPCVNIDGVQVQEFSTTNQTTDSSDPDTEPWQTQVIPNAFRDVETQTDACIGFKVKSPKSRGKTTAASKHCDSKSPNVVSDVRISQSHTPSGPKMKIITTKAVKQVVQIQDKTKRLYCSEVWNLPAPTMLVLA